LRCRCHPDASTEPKDRPSFLRRVPLTPIERVEGTGSSTLLLSGDLTLADAPTLWGQLQREIPGSVRGESLNFDLSRVATVDGAAMAMLVHVRGELVLRGVKSEFVGASDAISAIVHLYRGDVRPARRRRRRPPSALAQIGTATLGVVRETQVVLGFFGDMLLAAVGLLREPKTGNWSEVAPIMERTGADAIPIVVLINFLVGFVMAFQGAVQLRQFGANLYVADLVGLSITRELGPLMTAIIVCGRSGAAFAAELGSMKVSEEIDALRTMGFGPMRYLVLPRTVALLLVMPILTLVGDFVGILGGLAVGITSLDLTISGYWAETRKVVHLWDIFSGVVKSGIFALVISLISCQQGFATTGGAEGVGRRTTGAVVSTLFALILVDATFTVIFHLFNR
jgi:phospholipid/cholesterol/gamma-HCH transport system permease protein